MITRRTALIALTLFALSAFSWSICSAQGCNPEVDVDCDGVNDEYDNCVEYANPDQADNDSDLKGDLCDPDDDNDGVPDRGGLSETVCPTDDSCDLDLVCSDDGSTCVIDDDCTPDLCEDQYCEVDLSPCDGDADCTANLCVGGFCTIDGNGCIDDIDCITNSCGSGFCSESGDPCSDDADCVEVFCGSTFCSLGENACRSDADCLVGDQDDYCLEGLFFCVLGGSICETDDDCPPLVDECRNSCAESGATCSSDADCVVSDCDDNCPFTANPDQTDSETATGVDTFCGTADDNADLFGDDGICGTSDDLTGDEDGDACDNCVATYNPDQANADDDLEGNACDLDIDGDSFLQEGTNDICSVVPDPSGYPPGPSDPTCLDNCPLEFNLSQWDHDADFVGTVCDNCILVPNPDQINGDGDDSGDVCDNCPADTNDDQMNSDDDALGDVCDNCTEDANQSQEDIDFDEVGDACDNCRYEFNPDQEDIDSDWDGDVCDPCPFDHDLFGIGFDDIDFDLICNSVDNCPFVANHDQLNSDGDPGGDVCDCDRDGDGINDKLEGGYPSMGDCFEPGCQWQLEIAQALGFPIGCNAGASLPCCIDNCPDDPNSDQANGDGDGHGDACDASPAPDPGPSSHFDYDGDGWADAADNCPQEFNPDQADFDVDLLGDLCDPDADGDVRPDHRDNCLLLYNFNQADADSDGHGDPCDNCPSAANPNQGDLDKDLIGDRCDLSDGTIALHFDGHDIVSWEQESGFDGFTVISGDLALLRSGGGYLQDPGTVPFASVQCGASPPFDAGSITPAPGEAAFFLAGGATGIFEHGFGVRDDGARRIDTEACP